MHSSLFLLAAWANLCAQRAGVCASVGSSSQGTTSTTPTGDNSNEAIESYLKRIDALGHQACQEATDLTNDALGKVRQRVKQHKQRIASIKQKQAAPKSLFTKIAGGIGHGLAALALSFFIYVLSATATDGSIQLFSDRSIDQGYLFWWAIAYLFFYGLLHLPSRYEKEGMGKKA